MRFHLYLAALAIGFSFAGDQVKAQISDQTSVASPGIGMILLPVQRGADGQQYIITRAGYQVAVPGLGIDPNATQIATYQDAQNNFWYVNKNGQPTPVSAEQMQNVMTQIHQQQMMRQNITPQNAQGYPSPTAQAPVAPNTAPQQSTVVNNPAPSGGSSGSSALGTGLAAAGGAAVGAGLVNAINNNNQYPYGYGGMPYGQPIYREPSGQYYYHNPAASGSKVYVAPNSANSPYFNQYQQQGNWSDRNKWAGQTTPITASASAQGQNLQSAADQESGRRRRLGHGRSGEDQGSRTGGLQQAAGNIGQQERGSRRTRRQSQLGNGGGGLLSR